MRLRSKAFAIEDGTIDQAAALCCRLDENGELSALLITSLDTGRWVLPKGNIGKNEPPHRAAKRKALEEAGVVGKVRRAPIGFYSYLKDGESTLRVSVHALCVRIEQAEFRECEQREKAWFSLTLAAELVDEPDLGDLISRLKIAPAASSKQRRLSRQDISGPLDGPRRNGAFAESDQSRID